MGREWMSPQVYLFRPDVCWSNERRDMYEKMLYIWHYVNVGVLACCDSDYISFCRNAQKWLIKISALPSIRLRDNCSVLFWCHGGHKVKVSSSLLVQGWCVLIKWKERDMYGKMLYTWHYVNVRVLACCYSDWYIFLQKRTEVTDLSFLHCPP